MMNAKLAIELLLLAACNAAPQAPNAAPKSPSLRDALASINANNAAATLKGAVPRAILAKTVQLQPKVRPQVAKRIDTQFGPYVLAGRNEPKPKGLVNSLDPKGQGFADLILDGLCNNCTVLAGRTKVTWKNGTETGPREGIYVHHIVNRDYSKPVNLPVSNCGEGQKPSDRANSGKLSSEFLAQGDDSQTGESIYFTSKNGQFKSGYFFGPETLILNRVDLVNYNAESREVYVNYEIEYVEGHDGSDAAATLMSVTGCQDSGPGSVHIKTDKNGEATTESPKFPVSKDATIVSSFGHMHDGGTKMLLLINDKKICESDAVYGKGTGDSETILYMSECPDSIPIKKGDFLQLKSVYDLKSHPIRDGSEHNSMNSQDLMGMFYMVFATSS